MKPDLLDTTAYSLVQAERPKAVVYVRVSSKKQEQEGNGRASQTATCRQYAERMGYDVVEVFSDTITGSATDRRGMQALLKFLNLDRNGGLIVIVDHLNRFSRDVRGYWDLRDLVKAAGGRLESPNGTYGDSSGDRLVQNMLISASQYQKEQNSEQTRSRQEGRLLDGYWPFIPPRAMFSRHIPGRGKVLMRLEPEASVIAEALEAFADNRLRTQAEVARWLDAHPQFDKGSRKHITIQQAYDLLTNFLYAGVVERPEWGITRRKGQHEGLISYATFERIQARLNDTAYAPARSDVNSDFPLRGSVCCAECRGALTACWSRSKTGARHPYYMCFAKDCSRYRKSIRRDQMEAEFVALLESLTPKPKLMVLAKAMFRNAWDQRVAQLGTIADSYDRQIADADKKITTLLDRIVEASSATVIGAFERRINDLERSKLLLAEKREESRQPMRSFDEMFELAFAFLENPARLWHLGRLEYRKLVLRLAFREPLAYAPAEGFSNPRTTMPFKVSEVGRRPFEKLAERMGFEPTRPF